jgi:Dipeptidyl peptidase IV (DPP IV) N-terminal region.
MRDPKWIGSSPSNPYWSADSKYLLFSWNPDNQVSDSVYFITPTNLTPQKTTHEFREKILRENSIRYNAKRTHYVYAERGDIYLVEVKTGQKKRITQTVDQESNPQFSFNDTRIVYNRGNNLYSWDLATGVTAQLANFSGSSSTSSGTGGGSRFGGGGGGASRSAEAGNVQEKWLKQDALRNSEILQQRREMRELRDSMRKLVPADKPLMRTLSTAGGTLFGTSVSSDGRFVAYRVSHSASGGKSTIVPNYVTESGFTENIPARTKVGSGVSRQEVYIYDREKVPPGKSNSTPSKVYATFPIM